MGSALGERGATYKLWEHLALLFLGALLTLCTSAWPSGLHSSVHLMGILEVRMAPRH